MKKAVAIPLIVIAFVVGIAISDYVMQGISSVFNTDITTKADLEKKLAEAEVKQKEADKKILDNRNQYNRLNDSMTRKQANLDNLLKEIDTKVDSAMVKSVLLSTPISETGDKGEIFLNPQGTESLLKPTSTDDPTVDQFKKTFNKKAKEILDVSKGIMKDKIGQLNKEVLRINDQLTDRNVELIKKLRQEDKLKKQVGKLNEDLSTANSALSTANSALQDKNQQLSANLQEVEKYKKELDHHKKYINDLEGIKGDLQKTVGVLETKIENGRLKVSFKGDILFESGAHELRTEGRDLLEKVFPILLKSMGKNDIFVAGHTDNVPIREDAKDRYESNWTLSTYRAIEVVKYLVSKGMTPDKLTAAGYGEYKPLTPNTSPKGKAKNRRVELFLIPRIIKR
ncbi:MAG: OmpA family protein [bacterium]|nr:OmpA family protein [bacterium]